MQTKVEDANGSRWMVKHAETAEEAARLQHEADLLGRAAHPGVVQLGRLDVDDAGMATLWTRDTGGYDLRAVPHLDAASVAGLGAAVATIVADLHDLGIAHGAIGAEHVLIGADGRPVLCSFGRGGEIGEVDPAVDIAAIRQVLSERLPADAPRRLVRELSSRPRRGAARALAASLAEVVSDAHLPAGAPTDPSGASRRLAPTGQAERPGTSTPGRAEDLQAETTTRPVGELLLRHPLRLAARSHHPAPHRQPPPGRGGPPPTPQNLRRRRRVSILVAGAAVIGVAGLVAGHALVDCRRRPAARDLSVSCPTVDAGCRPVDLTDGRFSTSQGRFAIDLASAEVVVGRWRCGSTGLPAALDRANGQVWVWDRWAGTARVEARALTRVRDATGLEVLPQASGCDWLEVFRSGRPSVIVRPRQTADHA